MEQTEELTTTQTMGSFMGRVNTTEGETTPPILPDPNELSQLLSTTVDWGEFTRKINSMKQESVTIKEVILESKVQLVETIRKMKAMYANEVTSITQRMNDLYISKLAEIDKLHRETLIGEKLINLINRLDGWQLLLKPNSAQLCKFYTPAKPVTISISECNKTEKEYHEPVCHIKAIYVNLLHSKITRGTIMLSTVKQHPNVDEAGLGTACVGQLDRREINLTDVDALITLLQEIETTYESIHEDSAYYYPGDNGDRTIQFTLKEKGASIWNA